MNGIKNEWIKKCTRASNRNSNCKSNTKISFKSDYEWMDVLLLRKSY